MKMILFRHLPVLIALWIVYSGCSGSKETSDAPKPARIISAEGLAVQGYVLYPRDSSAVVGATVQSDPPSAIAVTENDGWFLIGQNLRSGTRYRFSAKLGDTQGYEGSTYYTVHSTGRTQGAVDTIYIYLGLDGFDMDIDSELQEGADGQKCQGINCIQVNPIH